MTIMNYTPIELACIVEQTQQQEIVLVSQDLIVKHRLDLVEMNVQNEKVREIEQTILKMPQLIIEINDFIHGKMYSRTMFCPAGAIVTGALSKIDNICIMHGDVTVTTDYGLQRFTGYHVLPSFGGGKRALLFHADTYWTTLIHTETTDCKIAEEEFTDEADMLQSRKEGKTWQE